MSRRQGVLLASAFAAVLFLALGAWGCSQRAAGPQTIAIAVTDRGFEPARIKARAGQPLALLVTRRTDATCAKEIVIAEANINRELPLDEEVRIEFTPEKSGELRYACGMDMIAGTITLE